MDVIELTKKLISFPTVTADDNGCQAFIKKYLEDIGFTVIELNFGKVKNLWARIGDQQPLMVFAGHTDVVPSGPESHWSTPPFEATIEDNILYGRGAADMKGNLSAMIKAAENLIQNNQNFKGSIGFLITGDEEGDAIDGTVKVVEWLQKNNITIDYCIVGEPTSTKQLGDTIKIGRRGSLHGKLKIIGKQGHIAYPELADNPSLNAANALQGLMNETWDKANEYFPATSFQISNIHAGTGAKNVIPGLVEIDFNFRFSSESTVADLQIKVESILKDNNIPFEIEWRVSGEPFISKPKKLANTASEVIEEICDVDTKFSTTGGTSDARFIVKLGCEIIELGCKNKSIHQVDECVAVEELEILVLIYKGVLAKLIQANSQQ